VAGHEDLIREYEEGMIFTAFDLETTGLDPVKDEIAEIGALRFDRRGPLARFSVLVNPGVPMPPGAGRVNNLSDAMLRDAPPLEEALPGFFRFISGTILVAHNSSFDCDFINAKLERFCRAAEELGLPEPGGPDSRGWTPPFRKLPNPLVDTLALARELFPEKASHKLQALAAELRIAGKEAHRAEDDAAVCMRFFLHCLEKLRSSSVA
jgi:DNA polymerase-3 subunit epsilon